MRVLEATEVFSVEGSEFARKNIFLFAERNIVVSSYLRGLM